MTGGNHQIDHVGQCQQTKPSAQGRLLRKQKQLLDVMYVYIDVSADKSSTESENEGFPLTQLPAESRLARRRQCRQVLPAMSADRRSAILRASKCLICIFNISQIFILSPNDLSEPFFLNVFFNLFTKLIYPWPSA